MVALHKRVVAFAGVVVFLTPIISSGVVSAKTTITDRGTARMYALNNIIGFQGDENLPRSTVSRYTGSGSPCISSTATNSDNATAALSALLNAGYSPDAAAAILGNLQGESGGINPKKLQGGKIVDDDFVAYENGKKTYSGGFGIVQWTSAGRVKGLQEYADNQGLLVSSLEAQLGYMMQELSAYGYPPSVLNNYSLEEAVWEIYKHYESPGSSDAFSSYADLIKKGGHGEYDKRLGEAQKALGGADNESLISDNCTSGNVSYTGNPDFDNSVNSNGYTGLYPFYNQFDPRWKDLYYGIDGIYGKAGTTIGDSGCGPSSFAMLASALTGKTILPSETADIAGKAGMHVQENGKWKGSSWRITEKLAEAYGLKYENISSSKNASTEDVIAKINSYLEKGWMIHTSGTGPAPFTNNGHYVGIYGISSDGKWIMADSAGSSRTPDVTRDPKDVVSYMNKDNIHAITN